MSRRRAHSTQDQPKPDRTAAWVEMQASMKYVPGRQISPVPSCSTIAQSTSSSSTRATTLSRASGQLVLAEKREYDARKQRTVVSPPATHSHSSHATYSHSKHSQSQSMSIAAVNGLRAEDYKRAPALVTSPPEEGWPKQLPGRPQPSKPPKASKPPTAFLRKRRPSDASQGGSVTGFNHQPQEESTRNWKQKPLPPPPVSPVRQWTL